jgi:MoxR-like ATPase
VDIPDLEHADAVLAPDEAYRELGSTLGDRRDGRVYLHDPRIRTAVRVAIAARRPLLLRGDPGSGKSSLAPYIARLLHWRFYSFTVTGRTQARDLMWHFDALRRLSDAQARPTSPPPGVAPGVPGSRVEHLEYYVEPKALWWGLNPESARRRGFAPAFPLEEKDEAKDPGIGPPSDANVPYGHGAVVLVDELDKADPDVPNNLLEALGSLQFTVQETGFTVRASEAILARQRHAPLVIVTTNDERELPAAFQRRCVSLYLDRHGPEALVRIAERHFAVEANAPDAVQEAERRRGLFDFVATELTRLQEEALDKGRREPSTAEYLDAVQACLALPANPVTQKALWDQISEMTLSKHDPFGDKRAARRGAAAP